MEKCISCLGLLLGWYFGLFGQQITPIAGQSLMELQKEEVLPIVPPNLYYWPVLEVAQSTSSYTLSAEGKSPAYQRLPDLAFFCRMEEKMQRAARLPVKFRLGEVQYTEQMEGKLKKAEQVRN